VIKLDGSQGEGGGQILRSALTLSLITGKPFRIENIRAGRRRPGLLRQHLTAVEAAAAVGHAQAEGADIGGTTLVFRPGHLEGGNFTFSVGTAGSTTLVLQTVLPALVGASQPSVLIIEGGTHNPAAPPFDFLQRAYLPVLSRMGPQVQATMERPGFYPAGGGRLQVAITPSQTLSPFVLDVRGEVKRKVARAMVAGLPRSIAARELSVVTARLGLNAEDGSIETLCNSTGPGNAVLVEIESEHITEVFVGFGEKNVSAEAVATQVAEEAAVYLASGVPVGPHLADQLILLLALAGQGSFCTSTPTPHSKSQLATIEQFMGPVVKMNELGSGVWRFSA